MPCWLFSKRFAHLSRVDFPDPDEPTSALDPELEQEVIKVIKDLAKEGRTMIIVTHDMQLAADVSDHVVFLHKGLIEEEGSPSSLFKSPKSERLQKFLSSTRAA